MYAFEYQRAASVAEAAGLLAKNPEAKLLAGGQTFIPTLKARLAQPSHVVDIGRLKELAGIEVKGGLGLDWRHDAPRRSGGFRRRQKGDSGAGCTGIGDWRSAGCAIGARWAVRSPTTIRRRTYPLCCVGAGGDRWSPISAKSRPTTFFRGCFQPPFKPVKSSCALCFRFPSVRPTQNFTIRLQAMRWPGCLLPTRAMGSEWQ